MAKKSMSVAEMVYSLRNATVDPISEVYVSFICDKCINGKGVSLYTFNDGSKIEQLPNLKIKKHKGV